MSTKIPLAYGDSFHFYKRIFDEQYVYLELEGVEFEASQNRIKLSIPIGIWEVIRKLGAPDLSLVDKSDQELLQLAEKEVDKQIEDYQQNLSVQLLGFYADQATRPREEQTQESLKKYQEERQEQQKIKAMIDVIAEKVKFKI